MGFSPGFRRLHVHLGSPTARPMSLGDWVLGVGHWSPAMRIKFTWTLPLWISPNSPFLFQTGPPPTLSLPISQHCVLHYTAMQPLIRF